MPVLFTEFFGTKKTFYASAELIHTCCCLQEGSSFLGRTISTLHQHKPSNMTEAFFSSNSSIDQNSLDALHSIGQIFWKSVGFWTLLSNYEYIEYNIYFYQLCKEIKVKRYKFLIFSITILSIFFFIFYMVKEDNWVDQESVTSSEEIPVQANGPFWSQNDESLELWIHTEIFF